MLTYYIIRQKSTGFVLPQTDGYYTHAEPVDPSKGEPRLFRSRKSANRSLGQWLRGVASKNRRPKGRGWFDEREYTEEIEVTPQPHRKRSDMEVVRVTLIIERPQPVKQMPLSFLVGENHVP